MQGNNDGQTFVFFGIVGSGKGTQMKLLMDFLKSKDGRECVYIGTGDIFRKIVEDTRSDDSSKEIVRDLLNKGKLIPDEQTNELVNDAVKSQYSPNKNLIFDGYPRTVPQSEFFMNLMESIGIHNIKIIYIELSEQEAMKRNLLRGRADDTEEGLKKRFEEYKNKVIPSIEYFRDKNGYTIYRIKGEQTVENVQKDIIKALDY